ncbi:MAG: hypothetical protein ACYCQJ_06165 [Nitrososphaerales archaeon]
MFKLGTFAVCGISEPNIQTMYVKGNLKKVYLDTEVTVSTLGDFSKNPCSSGDIRNLSER